MKTHLIFAAAALSLAAAGAHAAPHDTSGTYGEQYPDYTQTMAGSSLTREAVVADLMEARRAGTLPRYGEWDQDRAPLAGPPNTLTRDAVRSEGMAAERAGTIVNGDQ
ncbi:hypothetical protein B2J86_06580 [Acidovorax sp. SRB_14]|uniref:DUF4148 domain-containing protein n=1 Tax=unclassified Acidovorax TaxID=2684926 RepID=UPI00145E5B36|nr:MULTISPECIES: DUF4148 domain-containing protein [unclassified Acidovorax]NMM76612.1 hypothetical protein [Acidovorax sp. SRB_24]NMM80597.1 hypothetical protein [Acidovorax sp. SRB_14]NMM89870.1 hypothetical protein [Rhodococcus sp. SRB_17]